MKLNCVLILCLATHAFCAEEKRHVPEFTLTDGRVVQAMRLIRISTPGDSSYLITLADGRKMAFTDEEVAKIGYTEVPISALPASLNVEKKVAPAPAPAAKLPDSAQVTETDEPGVPNENPDDVPYVPYNNRRRHRPCNDRSGFHSRQMFHDSHNKPFCHCLTHLLNQVDRPDDNPAQVAGNVNSPSNESSVRPAVQSPVTISETNSGNGFHANHNSAAHAIAAKSSSECKTPNSQNPAPPVSNSTPVYSRNTPSASASARSAFSSIRSFQSMNGNLQR